MICALGNLHYEIPREKFEPDPEVRIPVLVQIFLLRSYNFSFVYNIISGLYLHLYLFWWGDQYSPMHCDLLRTIVLPRI